VSGRSIVFKEKKEKISFVGHKSLFFKSTATALQLPAANYPVSIAAAAAVSVF
jgi:hypothetical protein